MKSALQKLISSSTFQLRSTTTAIIKYLFPSRIEREERRLVKQGDKLYKSIVIRLKVKEEHVIYRRELLLHRRLKQYQRLRRHGGRKEKVAAIMRLQKEWRKFQRKLRIEKKLEIGSVS